MTGQSDVTKPVAKPQKPYQFTVRTFFAAAVWLSLLLGAITTLRGPALGTSLALLAWIALGEVYRRLQWVGPMVALAGGPVLLLCLWMAVLKARLWLADDELIARVFAFGFAWGIVLSLLTAVERVIEYRLLPRPVALGKLEPDPPSHGPRKIDRTSLVRCATILFSIHTAIPSVAGAAAQFAGGLASDVALAVLVLVDLPLLPLYGLVVDPGRTPQDTVVTAMMSLVLGGALYAALGLGIDAVIMGIQRGATRSGRRGNPPERA